MVYYGNFMNTCSSAYGHSPVTPLGLGFPATSSIGLPGAIPTSRTTVVHYGPPTVIIDPMTSEFVPPVAGIPSWGIGEMANFGYAY